MESHEENVRLAASPKVIVNLVREGHQYFIENQIDESYQTMALDLVRRYVSYEGTPRETDPLYAAALFIVTRHPWSHPNPLTKTEFAAKFRMKETSLEWYADSIVEKLGFLTLHDQCQLPFYADPQGTISSVIDSIVSGSVGEAVVHSIVTGSVLSTNALAEKIVDRLCSIVKIVPKAFERELLSIVQHKIDKESKRLLKQLEQQDFRY